MADDIIAVLDFDGAPALATIDEIIAALEQLSQAASSVGDASGGMSTLDDILTAIQANTDATAAGFDQLDASLSTLIGVADEAAVALQSIDAAFTEMAASAEEPQGALETLDAEMRTKGEDAATMGDALTAAQGPLMMVAGVALMAGGAFFKMGEDGQKGEALLRGMAGASQEDINALEADALKLGVGMDEASKGFYMVESAGYSGAAAIKVFDASMRLAEGGQAQAETVMTGVTAIMHDYSMKADQATTVTDKMAMAVFQGKQSMQDFATSIGPLAAAGHKAGMSLDEVLAAEATMTQINPHVRQDTMQLAALFDSLDPKMGKVQATAKKLGLSFNEAHYDSLSLLGKLQYLAQIAGGTTTPAFAKLTGGVRGATAANDIMMGKAGTFINDLHAIGHSAGQTEFAFQQYENTVPGALGHVGAALSIFATKLMDALGPKVVPIINKIADAIGKLADFLISHMDVLIPILAALAAIIGVSLIVALVALVMAAGPVLLIIAAIGAAVGIIVAIIMHWGQIMQWFSNLWHTIWNAISNFFKAVWNAIVNIAKVAGIALFIMLTGPIGLLVIFIITHFTQLKTFIGNVFSAIGTFVHNAITWIYNHNKYVKEFVDLVTNFLHNLWQTVQEIFQYIADWIQMKLAYVQAIVQAVWSLISDFITTKVNDIKTTVGNAFSALGTAVHDKITALWNWLKGFIGGWPAQAFQWGVNLIQGLINGIKSMVGNVASAVGNIAHTIAGFLGFHSPAKEGPGRDADQWGPAFTRMFAQGLAQGTPQVQSAALGMAAALRQSLLQRLVGSVGVNANLGSIGGGSLAGGGIAPLGGNAALPLLAGILSAIQQGNKPQGPQVPPTSTMYNNMNLYGVQNLQDLYAQLNSLQGYSFENSLRGGL